VVTGWVGVGWFLDFLEINWRYLGLLNSCFLLLILLNEGHALTL